MYNESLEGERIADLQHQLEALMGRTKAMEYGLRLLIASAPAPLLLENAWARMLPELLELHEEPEKDNTLYKLALVHGLKVISDQLHTAAHPNN